MDFLVTATLSAVDGLTGLQVGLSGMIGKASTMTNARFYNGMFCRRFMSWHLPCLWRWETYFWMR